MTGLNRREQALSLIVTALCDVPYGYSQAVDRLRCAPGVIDLSDRDFSQGLYLGVKYGVIAKGHAVRKRKQYC